MFTFQSLTSVEHRSCHDEDLDMFDPDYFILDYGLRGPSSINCCILYIKKSILGRSNEKSKENNETF